MRPFSSAVLHPSSFLCAPKCFSLSSNSYIFIDAHARAHRHTHRIMLLNKCYAEFPGWKSLPLMQFKNGGCDYRNQMSKNTLTLNNAFHCIEFLSCHCKKDEDCENCVRVSLSVCIIFFVFSNGNATSSLALLTVFTCFVVSLCSANYCCCLAPQGSFHL